jgi:hypothetical protein
MDRSLSLRTCLAAFIDGGGTGRLRLRTSVLRTCLRQAARVYVHCGEREDCGEDMSTLGRRTASYRAGGSEGWDTPSCPVEQISEKLEDALTLLTGGGRMAVPRQRTLKGTLDWSHDLLGEPEQVMFRRLAVFASGWTLEASRAVASGEGIEEGDALELLCVVSPRVLCRPPSHYPTRCQRRTPLRRGKEEA